MLIEDIKQMIHRMILGGEVVVQIHYNEGHLFPLYVSQVLMVSLPQGGMEQGGHLRHRPLPLILLPALRLEEVLLEEVPLVVVVAVVVMLV
jgi:hypothetical protein